MVPWPDLQNIKIDVSNQLNVNQKVEITGQRIYIVGMTTAGRNGVNHYGSGGSSSGYFFLDVEVGCGKESITASIGTQKFSYQRITGTETILESVLK